MNRRNVLLTIAVGLMTTARAPEDKNNDPRPFDPPAEVEKKASDERAAIPESKGPLPLELPKPAFKGTPQHVPPGTRLAKPRKGPRPPFLAPPGVRNVARGKPVTSSDEEPIIGEVELSTDGKKDAEEGAYVELGPGLHYLEIDLLKEYQIFAVVIWHFHGDARIYHDVVVQIANDRDFITGVKTLFNNDHDNSAGLGVGDDPEYWETYEGKLIDAKGVTGRFVRLYSNGSTGDDQNHYTEVEVYARLGP